MQRRVVVLARGLRPPPPLPLLLLLLLLLLRLLLRVRQGSKGQRRRVEGAAEALDPLAGPLLPLAPAAAKSTPHGEAGQQQQPRGLQHLPPPLLLPPLPLPQALHQPVEGRKA